MISMVSDPRSPHHPRMTRTAACRGDVSPQAWRSHNSAHVTAPGHQRMADLSPDTAPTTVSKFILLLVFIMSVHPTVSLRSPEAPASRSGPRRRRTPCHTGSTSDIVSNVNPLKARRYWKWLESLPN